MFKFYKKNWVTEKIFNLRELRKATLKEPVGCMRPSGHMLDSTAPSEPLIWYYL